MKNVNDELSPFEFKNELLEIAHSNSDQLLLNAGRGNPNFLALVPRHAYLQLGEFALHEASRSYAYLHSGFGGIPEKAGLVGRFDAYLNEKQGREGIELLRSALSFADDHLGISKQDLLFELTGAFLGCNYPFPPRMLNLCEEIVKLYVGMEMCGTSTGTDHFDCFATEGGTAAMTYFFQTLRTNGLLKKGDKIAIITPIFSPYLEIPNIPEYGLETIYIRADEAMEWQLSEKEIGKLEDPAIKLLCMVNPSNPPSVKMSEDVLNRLASLIERKRQDLMIVTDDVYATFSDDFESVFSKCPHNTLCVYSFSKYFGCTGWRLGVMALHHDNIFDKAIAKLPEETKERLDIRYASLTNEIRSLKFIDRLVADSRTVALNHTAGISGPQQLQMTLFALYNLLDESRHYQASAKRLIRRRYDILYQAIGVKADFDENLVGYYSIIDLEILSEQLYDKKFQHWLMDNINCYDLLRRLAKETSVVLLPGKGFEVDHPSVRVSLANLTEFSYRLIGLSVKKILEELHAKMQE